MNAIPRLSRRGFLATASATAGAFTLGWRVPQAQAAPGAGAEIGVWAVVHPDDTVVIRIARSEMGQGTLTGLAQLVADEMDAAWPKVRWEYVAPEENQARKRAWGDMSTGGSRGLRGSVDYVRKGGAAARAMLIAAAAQQWGVAPAECSASESVVTHTPTQRSLRYGELAASAAQLPVPADPKLKSPAEWKLIGKPLKRLDTAEKLDGSLLYAIDVAPPGLLNAAILQCPVFGGKLVGFDAAALAGMPGIHKVVAVDEAAVAVVADKYWQARRALDALQVTWDSGANATVQQADIEARVAAGLDATDQVGIGNRQGDIAPALAAAAKTVTATYATPFLAHATMEPMNCTAKFDDGGIEIWVASQNGDASLAAAAEAAGVPLNKVRVHKHALGGGFGRRGQQDYVRQAVAIAKQFPGRPVKMIWSREEDMRHDFFRPITQAKMTAALDKDGAVTALHARVSGQSILSYLMPDRMAGGTDMIAFQGWTKEEFGYTAIPNLLIDYAMRNSHVPVGFWRGVATNQNTIYMECFIDELAQAAGKDQLEFRRALLAKSPKHLAVLNAVAAKAEWGKPLPAGVFRGIAQNFGFGSFVAAVAEVSVSPQGEVRMHRIVAGTDPGHIANSQQVEAQVDGSFAYGLSALFFGENRVQDGAMVEANFDTYQVIRMAQMPRVETVLVPSGGFWGGVGEPTIAVAPAAVLNAIAAATGTRHRTLPLKHHGLTPA